MNQAVMQFTFDLQRFAEGEAPAAVEGTTEAAPAAETAPAEPAQAEAPQAAEPEKHISEMSDEEQTEYIKRHFLGEDEQQPQQQEQPQQAAQAVQQAAQEQPKQQEPTFEITVNGEKKQVTQSELISLAQKGEDYTRKTQALAQQRREFEEQVNQYRQQMTQQPRQQQPPPQVSPSERMNAEYQQAVGLASRNLGIKPEDFNQFDPVHAYALQTVIVQANMQVGQAMTERQKVRAEVEAFGEEMKRDPLTPKISDAYEEWILRRGLESKDGAKAAQAVAMAYSRFNAGNPTRQDCRVLKEHWEYVKGKVAAPQAAPAPVKPAAAPPRTEAPGVGRSSNTGSTIFDKGKLRSLATDPDKQMAYLKSLGIFND